MAVFVRCDQCKAEGAARTTVLFGSGWPKVEGLREDYDLCRSCWDRALAVFKATLPSSPPTSR